MAGRKNESVFPGAKFGRLTVKERLPKDNGYYRVLCVCSCGKEVTPVIASIVNGTTKSCGCPEPGVGYGLTFPGAKFGRLEFIYRLPDDVKGTRKRAKGLCKCSCGKRVEILLDALVGGNTKSCGCRSREKTIARNKATAKWKRFSAKYPRTYVTWHSMMNRCFNKKQKSYKDYGAKGVRICPFLQNPWHFKMTLGKKPTKKSSLDRFPIHNGNYSCGVCKQCKRKGWKLNIRWASRKEQSLNRGDFNVMITAFGKTQTKSQWCEEKGLTWSCLNGRMKRGWEIEKALSTPSGSS